jgi:hypothetical protein
MLFMIIFFLVAPMILGIAWIVIFWVASLAVYLAACSLALLGIRFEISGDKNIWLLFLVVCGISYYVYHLAGDCGWAAAVFVFLSGAFMLFRSADIWRISG